MSEYREKCVVFYKPDEKPGWKAVKVMGNKEEVEKKCFENEACFHWREYHIFSFYLDDFKKDFVAFNEDAFHVHLTTVWIYRPELGRWFIDDNEEIPIPETACEITNELTMKAFFDDYYNDDIEELEYSSTRPIATVEFKTPQQKYVSNPEMLYVDRFMLFKFLRNMQRGSYAYYYQNEFTFDKFFAWSCGDNKIRFSIQNYGNNEGGPKTVFDVIVDKNLLIDTLYEQIEIMEREIPKIKKDPAHYPFVHYEYPNENDEE